MANRTNHAPIPQWRKWETSWSSAVTYENPVQDAALQVTFTSPSGRTHHIDGFWDGEQTWRVRFMPTQVGEWTFSTCCSDTSNAALHEQTGTFRCTEPLNKTRFDKHGAIRVSENHRFLEHADGTPFFWLADTVWNGPLLSDKDEWGIYVEARAEQKFDAAQWVTTQWIASPGGDRNQSVAFTGKERIAINPQFFQRLDEKADVLSEAGILNVPVLLWAARWLRVYSDNAVNPGLSLPEDQAILLARYMVARWGAHHVVWILNGDGHYIDEAAERWRVIGRGVFGGREHAPVSLHPGGWMWNGGEFGAEEWLDIWGYQSGHKLDEAGLRWLVAGEPATDWDKERIHPVINLEPPYENHMDMGSEGTRRISAQDVRRALYTSLLIAPTAGVSYGGHGVWGWDDGTTLPTAHPLTGMPLPWQEALHMPVAEQVRFLYDFFTSLEWWRLRPAQDMLLAQPGNASAGETIVAARTERGDLALVYTAAARRIELNLSSLRDSLVGYWFNPVNGELIPATSRGTREHACFETSAAGDRVLVLK